MARAVQRSLIAYLPTRKKALAVSHKEGQQQQTDAVLGKKLRASTPQYVESVQPALPTQQQSRHKRQRTLHNGALEANQHPSPLPSPVTAQTGQESAENVSELRNFSQDVHDASAALIMSPSTPHSSSISTDRLSSPLQSRRGSSMAGGEPSYMSREQRRRHDFVEQTVRACLQPSPHMTAEPTRAQLASLIHPSSINRPPLPRPPPLAAPSTPSKQRPISVRTPISSVDALAATAPTFSATAASNSSSLPLPLPVSYRLLLSVFSALECAITIRSHTSVLWSALSPAVIRIVQKSVTVSHLQQLACLVPDCYELREERSADGWGRVIVDVRVARLRLDDGRKQLEAGIVADSSAASSAELSQRRQLLEQRLLDRAIDEHTRWYNSSPHAAQPFDPLIEGRWHAAFPLDSLPPLPEAEVTDVVKAERVSALDALESLSGHKRKWEEVEPLTPRSSVSRTSSSASELLLTPSTRNSSSSSILSLLDTPVSAA